MSNSTRLSSQGGLIPTRDWAGSRPSRYIPPWVPWENLRDEVHDKYVVNGMSLNELMKHMSSAHNFSATPSQWKKQLSRWNMKRNLNAVNSAHVLRLYCEAEAAGIHRTVFCGGVEKSRENVNSYISKSEKFFSEDELLASIDGTPTPANITYRDNDAHLQTPPRIAALSSAPETSPTESSWTTADSGPLSTEHSLLLTPTSGGRLSNSSSYVSLSIGDMDLVDVPYVQREPDFEMDIQYTPEELIDETMSFVDSNAREEGLNRVLAPNTMSGSHMFDQLLARGSDFNFSQPGELIHSLVSGTPIVVGRDFFLTDAESVLEEAPRAFPMPQITEGDVNADHSRTRNDYDTFLSNCFGFCIFQGQGSREMAEEMLATAISSFEKMVAQQNDYILTSLNVLVAMLEAHGQLFVPMIVLERALRVAENFSDLPLIATVQFMLSAARRNLNMNTVEILRGALAKFVERFGEGSRTALTSKYNLAWALTQESRYAEALGILAPLKGECEALFGFCHVTTSCATATLARVYFRLKQPKEAEMMIAELIRRLEERLPKFHPYRLEALGRQALFLENLGDLSKAEQIIQQVTRDRFAVLGPDNPRSRSGFDQLRRILQKQGRQHLLGGLHQQYLNEVNYEYQNARWRAY